jgi:hypothetical protein
MVFFYVLAIFGKYFIGANLRASEVVISVVQDVRPHP